MPYTYADVIGFGGGFSLGMTQSGHKLVAKREIMDFGVAACEANRHILGWEWDSQVAKMSRAPDWDVRRSDIVVGNPPCSGFSTLTRAEYRGTQAAINDCMWAFSSYVAKARPIIAAFESVQHAFKLGRPLMQQLRARVEKDTGIKYNLTHLMHNGASLGGAANRPRYFWVISQIPFGVEYPEPDVVPTFKESIGDLRGLADTWEKQAYKFPESWWSHRRRSADGTVDGHAMRKLTHYTRVMALLDALDGDWPQGWREEDAARFIYEKDGRLPDAWASQEERLVKRNFDMGFNQMQRWYEDRPCRVITGGALSQAMHPNEPRLFTNREAARIQGFPDTWRLWPLRDVRNLHRTWGKGIPVDAGRWFGYWVKKALDGEPGHMIGEPVGERERLLQVDKGFRKALSRGRRRHEFWAA